MRGSSDPPQSNPPPPPARAGYSARVKRLVALAALLLVGCGLRVAPTAVTTAAPRPSDTASAPTSAGPTPAPTSISTTTPRPIPTPILGWDVPPKTGIAHVDAIVVAVIAGDAPTLERFITGRVFPCGGNEPVCPPGVLPGTSVSAFGGGGCPGGGGWSTIVAPSQFNPDPFAGVTTVANVAARLSNSGMRNLVGVYEDSGSQRQYRYRIVFQRQLRDDRGGFLYLTDQGIAEWIGVTGDPLHGCLVLWPGERAVVSPP